MGFNALSLLKRFRGGFDSSGDGDGYPPYLTSPFDDSGSSSSNEGGNQITNPTQPDDDINGPSETQRPGSNLQPTRPAGVGNGDPASGSDSETDNSQQGTNPGADPDIPIIVEGPGNPSDPGVGQPLPTNVDNPPPAPPSQTGSGTYMSPGIDPVATTESNTTSTDEPSETVVEIAASSGEGADSKTVIAIAVPVVVVCLAVLGGLFFFMWRRRKRQAARALASAYHIETNNPGMTEHPADTSSPTPLVPPPAKPIPTVTYTNNPAETVSSRAPAREPSQNTDAQRLSAVSVQLQRAQPSTVVTGRPQSHLKRHSAPLGSAALTEANLASLGDTPQGYSYQRPRSPFEHPDDDVVSAISGLSPGGHDPRNLGRDADEVSAVSSLEPADMPPRRTS